MNLHPPQKLNDMTTIAHSQSQADDRDLISVICCISSVLSSRARSFSPIWSIKITGDLRNARLIVFQFYIAAGNVQ